MKERRHQLNDHELSEVLAALAAWQFPGGFTDEQLQDMATDGGRYVRTETRGLQTIIDRLNREGEPVETRTA